MLSPSTTLIKLVGVIEPHAPHQRTTSATIHTCRHTHWFPKEAIVCAQCLLPEQARRATQLNLFKHNCAMQKGPHLSSPPAAAAAAAAAAATWEGCKCCWLQCPARSHPPPPAPRRALLQLLVTSAYNTAAAVCAISCQEKETIVHPRQEKRDKCTLIQAPASGAELLSYPLTP